MASRFINPFDLIEEPEELPRPPFRCKQYAEYNGTLKKHWPKHLCKTQCDTCLNEIIEYHRNKLKRGMAYQPNKKAMNFGQAIEALKEGKLVHRSGWNGKGMFIVKQIPAVIGTDIIPKMQSLPQSAKDVMLERNQAINYANQMLIVNSEGRADSWVPSSSDCFAEDWEVKE